MGRCVVQVVVQLLDVLTVVTLVSRKTEETLFQPLVLTVPQGDVHTHQLLVVTDTKETVLTPSEDTGVGVLEWEVRPGVTVLGVILTHSGPSSLTQVRTPPVPVLLMLAVLFQPLLLDGGVHQLFSQLIHSSRGCASSRKVYVFTKKKLISLYSPNGECKRYERVHCTVTLPCTLPCTLHCTLYCTMCKVQCSTVSQSREHYNYTTITQSL